MAQQAAFATGVLPDTYAFHRYQEFRLPLPLSSLPVSFASPELSSGVSQKT